MVDDGDEALGFLKSLAHRDVAVIAVTNRAMSEPVRRMLANQTYACIQSPFDAMKLLSLVVQARLDLGAPR
jgi:CheY-like chemotaxis protein